VKISSKLISEFFLFWKSGVLEKQMLRLNKCTLPVEAGNPSFPVQVENLHYITAQVTGSKLARAGEESVLSLVATHKPTLQTKDSGGVRGRRIFLMGLEENGRFGTINKRIGYLL